MYQAKSGVKKFSLYWGGGPRQEILFSILNMYQAKSGVKNFSFYWGRGVSLDKKIFFQSEHVSSHIWCQTFFPFTGGGVPLIKFFFFQSEHVSSQIWCQKFFPLLRLGPPPPPKCGQTENITSRHPLDAGGKKSSCVNARGILPAAWP